MLTRATFTHPHPKIGAATDAHLVLSLHGETGATTRPDVTVIPVVDVSGSMGTARKLTLVTTALAYLSEHLAATDRLGLVTFDSQVATPVPLTRADVEGVGAFTAALGRLRPGSMTALAAGITAGIAQARRSPSGTLARVVVLTDGQANVGPTDLDTLTGLVRNRPEHVTVSFLGVGSDCDHDLLGHLAEHGGGNYGFIESAGDAPAALGVEIGGLLDAEAHQVTVRIEARDRYCTLSADAPLGMVGTVDDDGALVCTVAQVLRGTTRHVIVPVVLHGTGRNHARPVTAATVHVTATIAGEPVSYTLRPKVKFTPEAGDVDDDLVEQVELAQVAQAIRDARTAASQGNFDAAREVFAGASLTSGSASLLRDSLAGAYADANSYHASAAVLSSARAAATGSLSATSASFTALASNTIGSLYSGGQRRMAAEASRHTGTIPGATAAPGPFADADPVPAEADDEQTGADR